MKNQFQVWDLVSVKLPELIFFLSSEFYDQEPVFKLSMYLCNMIRGSGSPTLAFITVT